MVVRLPASVRSSPSQIKIPTSFPANIRNGLMNMAHQMSLRVISLHDPSEAWVGAAATNNGKPVVADTTEWQVVGTLRKEPVTGAVEISSPLSLQNSPVSTSRPDTSTSVLVPGPTGNVVQLHQGEENVTGPVSSRNIGRFSGSKSTIVQQVSNKFAALDGNDFPDEGVLGFDGRLDVPESNVSEFIGNLESNVSEIIGNPTLKKGRGRGREAKVSKENLVAVSSRCFPLSWRVWDNAGGNDVARIVLGWDPNLLDVSLVYSSTQLLCVHVTCLSSRQVFYVSAVYGANSMVDRRLLWTAMRSLALAIGDSPWLQMGDFNVVLRSSERIGEFDSQAASEFRQCLFEINMEEMVTRGFWFTWTNRRGGGGANMSKIDRVLVNASWLDHFTESEAMAHAPGISDHCSLLVTVLKEVVCRKPFRFFNFWMKHHKFKDIVQNSWAVPVAGSAMFRLSMKLKRLKPVLRDLNHTCFSNISGRVEEAKQHMAHLQLLCAQNVGDENIRAQEKEVVRLYMELSAAEESFKKQKSRVRWLALGDQNTKFFHHKVSCNRMKNKILSLVDAEGVRLDKPEEVQQEIIGFYKGLLGTKFANRLDAKGCLQQIITKKVPSAMQMELTRPVSVDEIRSLREFHGFSGLQPNLMKSAIYLSGVSNATKQSLVALVGMPAVPIGVISLDPSLNDDVLGLIAFKADIQDPTGKLVSWNVDDYSPCSWDGIKCNTRSNRVTELVLDGFSLSGRVGRGLLQLQFLRKLSLARNNFTGNITPNLTKLENLRFIDFSENSLSGPIPDDFYQQCGSLRSISLANNKFSGQIQDGLRSCSSLVAMNFSANQFSGSLPSGIWSLHGLRSLDLSDNLLEGDIPGGIEVLNNLRAINLGKNKFTGLVPDGIGSCLLLRSIDFSENSLSGNLPSTMQKLTLCNDLNLHGNSFSGEVPDWIGEMKSLEALDLSFNDLSGGVPISLGNLQSLKVLNLSNNTLTGSLPSWIFQLGVQQVSLSGNRFSGSMDSPLSSSTANSQQKLQVLDLSGNALSGEIPSAVGDFSSLQVLDLSRNSLGGGIPASIGQLKGLNVLDLSENTLSGSIPLEIGGAISLKDLKLEINSLSGSIPTSIQNCSLLTTLVISRNNLTGQIPAAVAKLTNLHIIDLSFNKLTGTLPKELGNLLNLLTFNISNNQLQGELPTGNFFNTISASSVSGNPLLCGAAVNKPCPTVLPKPLVLNPNSSDSTPPGSIPESLAHKKNILSISALIAIGAAAMIIIGVIAITVLNLRVRSFPSRSTKALSFSGGDDFSPSPTTDANSGKLVMFSGSPDFSTGAHALLNKDCELGRGGFGSVYRTVLGSGRSVAIKKLTVSSLVKSQEDFEREVKKLGKIRHPNLVALEGYYWTPSLQLLIYEFVPGGNLYKHIHEGLGGNFLSWNDRFDIILGTAKSLAHLHQMNIIHYNLKSSNILIDGSGEPKVADFGLARLLPMLDRYVLSSKIQSALGYMAPEFACPTVKITEKCDVYGFGVLVLEVVTGKRPVEYTEDDVVVLCDMVRGALEEGRAEDCVDGRMQGKFPADEAIPVIKLGLICTSQVPSNRPDMGEVVNILELIRCPSEGQELLI
ncbi:hypothetical protein Vadar_015873 [Vaccinium darrowii]|uniref:Uncharacterized protein n=1 Tax=Vaccinium darrowii TaxID=229202 RepID=A0ACB7XI61_9ERIC|nr:hypothetical protein Vadar_015873 [Vaccinium darrowii]